MKFFSNNKYFTTAILLCASFSNQAWSSDDDLEALMQMPLKELMKMEVTSVSKKAEKATEAAAAIYVVSQEDIRRSGANSIPEALRMVPGMQVARIDSNRWAVSTRGYGEQFAKKLLVLIDGRTIYNPMFSGVSWEEQAVPVEEIERIEVIRGPGSTLWGANAVNGVINIITKNAKDSEGTTLTAGVGNFEKNYFHARHGMKLKNKDAFKAYASRNDTDSSLSESGNEKDDEWGISRAGFRYDGQLDKKSDYTLQGDVYKGLVHDEFDQLPSLAGAPNASGFLVVDGDDKEKIHGGNILARYNRELSKDSDISLQAYYDLTDRNLNLLKVNVQTLDFDMQHSFNIDDRNEFIWGLGYRNIAFDLTESNYFRFDGGSLQDSKNLFSAFAQDKIAVIPDELYLTLGSKFEHNDYTGYEVQPSARVAWLASKNQTVWGAVTKSVRTPSYIEENNTNILGAVPGPAFVAVTGDGRMESEELVAYEIGYKTTPTDNTSLDLTAFVNDYDSLRTLESAGGIAPDIAASFVADNKARGQAVGFEVAGNWEVSNKWALSGSYSYLDFDLILDDSSTDTLSESQEGKTPNNMFNIRSHYLVCDNLELDNALYYVDKIKGTSAAEGDVDSYFRFDTKITYHPMEGVETSLIGQNLFDDQHQEFGSAQYNTVSEIPRSVFGKVTVRF